MTVLNVDDSVTMRKIVGLVFSGDRHTLHEAGNGQEALDFCSAQGDPDLIILDINMPVMTGLEFLERYRGGATVVVLTTQSEDDVRKKALLLGARAFLTKPFQKADLEQVVRELGLPL